MQSINELIDGVRAAAADEPDAMISLTLRSDDTKWAQILADKINLSFPFDTPPATALADLRLPYAEKARVAVWDANLYADFDTTSMSSPELSEFLGAYLVAVFGTCKLCDYDLSSDVAERGRIEAETTHEFLRKIVELKQRLVGKLRRNRR